MRQRQIEREGGRETEGEGRGRREGGSARSGRLGRSVLERDGGGERGRGVMSSKEQTHGQSPWE